MYIYLLFLHYLSDWILQTRYLAENKTKNKTCLIIHCLIIFATFYLGLGFITGFSVMLLGLCILNGFTHYFLDLHVWSLYKRLNGNKPKEFITHNLYAKDYWFYFTIAIDSFIHISIIFLLFGAL